MPDYSLGKIYKIVGNGKVYVGSSTRPLLSQRLARHKSEYKRWLDNKTNYVSSYEVVCDVECYIELLELCPCSCIDELRKCEGKWIRELECVNKNVAGQTITEYNIINNEKYKAYRKAWYAVNKEKHKENVYKRRNNILNI